MLPGEKSPRREGLRAASRGAAFFVSGARLPGTAPGTSCRAGREVSAGAIGCRRWPRRIVVARTGPAGLADGSSLWLIPLAPAVLQIVPERVGGGRDCRDAAIATRVRGPVPRRGGVC